MPRDKATKDEIEDLKGTSEDESLSEALENSIVKPTEEASKECSIQERKQQIDEAKHQLSTHVDALKTGLSNSVKQLDSKMENLDALKEQMGHMIYVTRQDIKRTIEEIANKTRLSNIMVDIYGNEMSFGDALNLARLAYDDGTYKKASDFQHAILCSMINEWSRAVLSIEQLFSKLDLMLDLPQPDGDTQAVMDAPGAE